MIKINIKPLSVNEAWKGKRTKSIKYKQYATSLHYLLPNTLKLKDNMKYILVLEFGVSSSLFDWDNGVKQFQDCLVKKYKVDDRNIYTGIVNKVITKKGDEYVKFEFIERSKSFDFEQLIKYIKNN